MLSHTEAQIFLSAQRGCTQTEGYRSFHTLNFGPAYFEEHRKPCGNLLFLNDDTLGQTNTIEYDVEKNTILLILPLVGACAYYAGLDQGILEPGQVHFVLSREEPSIEISNAYEAELINYLSIGLCTRRDTDNLRVSFDIDKKQNALIPIVADSAALELGIGPIHIGKFDGRQSGTYRVQNPKGVFLFVIEGAFEVQNRLIQARDGLALQNVNEIEFESLSHEAILLVIESV